MVKNLFSQITDSKYFSGTYRTFNLTDNVSMTNASQSYTTVVDYTGQIDRTSTRYTAGGIGTYTYLADVAGPVTASVHPYEYTTTTTLQTTSLARNTSVSNSYDVAVENSMSWNISGGFYVYVSGGWIDYAEAGELADVIAFEKPNNVTTDYEMYVSMWNYDDDTGIQYQDGVSTTLLTTSYRYADLQYGTIRGFDGNHHTGSIPIIGGRGNLIGRPKYYKLILVDYVKVTYSSKSNQTTSSMFLRFGGNGFDKRTFDNVHLLHSSFRVFTSNFAYLTYYSKSSSWNTLTTIITGYSIPSQTTTSWVEPRQLASKF